MHPGTCEIFLDTCFQNTVNIQFQAVIKSEIGSLLLRIVLIERSNFYLISLVVFIITDYPLWFSLTKYILFYLSLLFNTLGSFSFPFRWPSGSIL